MDGHPVPEGIRWNRRPENCIISPMGAGFLLLILGVALPVALLFQLWRGAFRDRVDASVHGAFVGFYVLDALLRLRWDWLGYPIRVLLAFLTLLVFARFFIRVRQLPTYTPLTWKSGLSLIGILALASVFGVFTALDVQGRRAPGEQAVSLHFPLCCGSYAIAHGGSNVLLNYHHPSRTQRYALDIVKLNSWGFRARGLYPQDVTRYTIWNDRVLAPCTGRVIRAVDGLPDRKPSMDVRDTLNPAGNHVILECSFGSRTVHVILAHLRQNSVRVATGDTVTAGESVGHVGNSGNTTEPHFHIHAYDTQTGDGIPVLFEGRFLVRNDVFRTGLRRP